MVQISPQDCCSLPPSRSHPGDERNGTVLVGWWHLLTNPGTAGLTKVTFIPSVMAELTKAT